MGLLAALLNVCQDTLSLISLSAGLIVFSPWLMVLLVAAVVPAFLGETHFTTLAYSVLYRWTPQRRQLDYLRMLGASVQSAKEIKIFGLGSHLSKQYHQISEDIYQENKVLAIRRASVGSALNLISTGGYYGAYAVVLMQDSGGRNLGRDVHVSDRRVLPLARLYRKDSLELQRHLRAGHFPQGPVRIFRDAADHPLAAGSGPGATPDPAGIRVPQCRFRLSGLRAAWSCRTLTSRCILLKK